MSNSNLVSCTNISPNKNSPRKHAIDTITIHCVVGQCTAERIGEIFAPSTRQASSNYGIGYDGRIGMYVEEKDRSWCSSSASNDHRAVTIEVASDTTEPYAVTDKAYAALIDLVTDICKRNGIKALLWKGDKSLIGQIDKQNMTVHRWFAAKSCPGTYLYNLHPQIAAEVNKRLGAQAEQAEPEEKPQEQPQTGGAFGIGDEVSFTGSKHYISANATNGKACKSGRAKITAIAAKGKHPFNLVKVTGGGSTVHGWVDAADVAGAEQAQAGAADTGEIKAGSTVRLRKGAKTYTGKSLASFVFERDHVVREVKGDRAVILYGNTVVAAVNVDDLTLS